MKTLAKVTSFLLIAQLLLPIANVQGASLEYKEPSYVDEMSVKITSGAGTYPVVAATGKSITLSDKYSILESPTLLLEAGSYTLSGTGTSFTINKNGLPLYKGSTITLFPVNYSLNTTLSFDSRKFPGTFEITSNYFINHLPLQHYLYGVVPYEIGISAPLEAQKAQAVAARGYASVRLGNVIDDSTRYQVYKGYNPTHLLSIKGVDETQGQIMTSGGNPVDMFYSSSNGGNTLSVWNSWGTAGQQKPYFTYKADPFDTVHRWNFSIKKKQIPLETLDLLNPDSWWSTTLEAEASSVPLAGLKSYMAGKSGVPASLNDFKITGIRDLFFTTPENTIINSSTILTGRVVVDYITKTNNVISSSSYTYENRAYNFYSSSIFGKVGVLPTLRSPNVHKVSLLNDSYLIEGGGFGHGIGMSQNGAISRASAGQLYTEILNFYYTGVTITAKNNTNIFTNYGPIEYAEPVETITYQYHTVLLGQTLYSISILYKTTVQNIIDLNGLISNSISVGQVLKVSQTTTTAPEPIPVPIPTPEPIPIPVPVPTIQYFTATKVSSLYEDTRGFYSVGTISIGQKLEILSTLDNGWLKVKSNNKELFIKDGLNSYAMFIPFTTGIYDSPSLTVTRLSSFKPTTLAVIQKQGEWYLVNTWLGEKWILPGYVYSPDSKEPYLFSPLNKTGIYSSLNNSVRLSLLPSNQSFPVVRYLANGWHIIKVNSQDVWAKDGFDDYSFTFTKTSGLYTQPESRNIVSSIAPGVYIVKEDGINGWKQIQTTNGLYWAKDGYIAKPTIYTSTTLESGYYSVQNSTNRLGIIPLGTYELLAEGLDGWKKVSYLSKEVWIKNGYKKYRTFLSEPFGLYPQENKGIRIATANPAYVPVIKEGSNGWFYVETYKGPVWVKNGVNVPVLNPELPSVSITNTSGLYSFIDSKDRLSILDAGSYKYKQKSGEWYLILVNGNEFWVKNGYNIYKYKMNEVFGLYQEQNKGKLIASAKPTTVIVLEDGTDGWIRISSWLGPMWTKDGVTTADFNPAPTSIYVTQLSGLYKEANTGDRISLIKPSRVNVIKVGENGWYQIQTWLGAHWVKDGVMNDVLTPMPSWITLTNTSGLYSSPNGIRVSALSAQTVRVLNQAPDQWYQVQTWLGPLWLKDGFIR